MDYSVDFLDEGIRELGIEIDRRQRDQLLLYYEILIKKNKNINITSITEYKEVVVKHFFDSLSIVKCIDLRNLEISMIDVGTGAGFPGLPLKIVFPQIKMILLDCIKKRIDFLEELIQIFHLEQIKAIHGRAESIGADPSLREHFDFSVSRAVSNLTTLSEYCIPFVKVGGNFIAYKSSHLDIELEDAVKAINLLGGEIEKVEEIQLPKTDIKRKIVCIKKIKNTNNKYPRRVGKPERVPIT